MTRRLPLLQASKLGLASECLFPWTSGLPWDDEGGAAADFGKAAHEFSAGLVHGCAQSVASLAEKHGVTAPSDLRKLEGAATDMAIHLGGLVVDRIEAELAIAYWPDTGEARVLAAGEERPPAAILLYVDILHEAGGFVTVLDWKTGRRPIIRRVEDTPQVRLYALAICKALGLSEIRVELGWLSSRGLWIDHAYFDTFDLAVMEEEVRELDERRRAGGAVPSYGLHCVEGFCPVMGACPAAQAAAKEVELATKGRFPLSAPTSDEHALDLYHRLPLARARLELLEKMLQEWATTQGALDLGDGVAWGKVEKQGNESVSATPEAIEVLQTHLGSHFETAVRTEVSTSKTDIDRAVRAIVAENKEKRGAKKKRIDPLVEELRKVGALRKGAPYFAFDKFKRAAESPEEAAE